MNFHVSPYEFEFHSSKYLRNGKECFGKYLSALLFVDEEIRQQYQS